MAGKRFTVRSRGIRWKEGRARIRRSRQRPPPTPNLTLDLVVAGVASLLAAGVVFCLAVILSGSHGVPLHLGYAVILGGVGLACLTLGPQDRGGRMIAVAIGVLWLIGSASLFAARADIVIPAHRHATVGQLVGNEVQRPALVGSQWRLQLPESAHRSLSTTAPPHRQPLPATSVRQKLRIIWFM